MIDLSGFPHGLPGSVYITWSDRPLALPDPQTLDVLLHTRQNLIGIVPAGSIQSVKQPVGSIKLPLLVRGLRDAVYIVENRAAGRWLQLVVDMPRTLHPAEDKAMLIVFFADIMDSAAGTPLPDTSTITGAR